MSKKNPTIYLIDGSAIIYRAYFAFIRNPLINSKGEDTSATFGFVNSILKIIDDEQPDYIAVVFDTKAPTFRHERYKEYKSTRAKMPEELVDQLPRIRQAIEALSIQSLEMEGYEADDIIGTIAKHAEKDGMEVWCVTGDKDYFQLVSDKVGIYYPRPGGAQAEKMGPEEVKAKFGVPPELVIDKLALMGDSSDNIPGVPGVGTKTADKLLDQFGTLDDVLTNHADIEAKGVREKVANNIESAKLSRELVTIETQVPIDYSLEGFERKDYNREATLELFTELEFKGLIKNLFPDAGGEEGTSSSESSVDQDYECIDSLKTLKDLIKRLSKVEEIAVDTETTSLNSLEAELVGVSLSEKSGKGYYIPLGHKTDDDNIPIDKALPEIKKLLENKKVQKIGQNIKYDLEVLHRYDIDIEPISFDPMLASYVIDPTSREHNLDALARKHCDYTMKPISDLIGSGKNQKSFAVVPVDQATFYAAEDADITYRLRAILAPKIDELELNDLYYNIELPLVKVLASMEEAGIAVDRKFLKKLSADMEKKVDGLKKEIYEIAGGEFNINSTQQLSHVLFDKLGLPTKGKTAKKTGYSTDVRVLEELAHIHEFPKLILDYRQFTKLKSTYVDAIPKIVNKSTGRVHTSFNQTIAATGRLSSTDPNLQNIPIRTDEGREIRRAFVPRDKDHVLLAADYSQIELRILAHYSNDKGLIHAFKNAEDIHSRTAAEVYEVDIDDVTASQRRAAKTANFAVIYGVTAFGLAQQTDLDREGAQQFIDTYFKRYPGIKDYIESTKKSAREHGYVKTLFNRRRNLPEIKAKNYNVRQFAERTAVNTPIQGTAADIIKKAMLRIHEKMDGMKSRMVLQVHDELVFDVHKSELKKVRKLVQEGMEKAVKLKVPIVADMGEGDNWLDCK